MVQKVKNVASLTYNLFIKIKDKVEMASFSRIVPKLIVCYTLFK